MPRRARGEGARPPEYKRAACDMRKPEYSGSHVPLARRVEEAQGGRNGVVDGVSMIEAAKPWASRAQHNSGKLPSSFLLYEATDGSGHR
jgi:hypothetical protein